MTLEVFGWVPSYEPEESHTPRLRAVQFGDGYRQAAPDGLNHDLAVWEVTFEHVAPPDADGIRDFLRARGGYQPFIFVPPPGYTALVVTCESWRRRQTGPVTYTVAGTFNESANASAAEYQNTLDYWGGAYAMTSSLQGLVDWAQTPYETPA